MSDHIEEITEAQLPQNIRNLWLKAVSALELQNHSYAISLCQAVLKEQPGFLEARKLARKCAITLSKGVKKKGNAVTQMFGGSFASRVGSQSKKDPKGALVTLEKELAKEPFNDQLNDVLFETARRLNLNNTASFALETVRKGSPENTKLLHKLAEFYLARDIPQKAADVYQDITKQDNSDIDAVRGFKDSTARASMQKDKWNENSSIDDITKDSDEISELEDKDRAAMTRDQTKEKLAKLMEQYNQDQNNLMVVKQIGKIYEDLEYWPDSYVFYNWAYELSNKDVTLRAKAENMKAKAADQTIIELSEQLAADPENAELQAQLIELKQERSKESVVDAQKRVDQNPTDPQLRFDLGLALYNSGDHNGAIPHLQQAKRNPHIRTRVLLTLGRTFDAKGMFDIAIKQLEEALEDLHAMDGTKKEVLYEMGLIFSKMGSKDQALNCFKQIYEVDYGYRDVAQRVEDAYGS